MTNHWIDHSLLSNIFRKLSGRKLWIEKPLARRPTPTWDFEIESEFLGCEVPHRDHELLVSLLHHSLMDESGALQNQLQN